MAISYARVEGYWIQAGGPKDVAPIAAAIALAESRGQVKAKNPKDSNGFPSWGLWQINNGNNIPPPGWDTPLGNAKLAVAKYNNAGGSFTPWGTFTSGAYRKWLKKGVQPVQSTPTIVTTSWISSIIGGGLSSNWKDYAARLGLILLGGTLLLVGLWMIAGKTNMRLEQDIIGAKGGKKDASPESATG